MAPRLLIVAYGNPLRSDDGVAWRAAAALPETFLPEEAEIVTVHQLGPELAESASRSECVIFVDAASGPGHPGEIQAKEVLPGDVAYRGLCLLSRHDSLACARVGRAALPLPTASILHYGSRREFQSR